MRAYEILKEDDNQVTADILNVVTDLLIKEKASGNTDVSIEKLRAALANQNITIGDDLITDLLLNVPFVTVEGDNINVDSDNSDDLSDEDIDMGNDVPEEDFDDNEFSDDETDDETDGDEGAYDDDIEESIPKHLLKKGLK